MEDLLNISVLSAHPLCVKADEAMPLYPGSLPHKSLTVCWDKNCSYLCLISNFSCGRLDYSKGLDLYKTIYKTILVAILYPFYLQGVG